MQQGYYDPMGVFVSTDPVTAYDSLVTNFCRYCYANNNLYKFTDPDGRQAAERWVEYHRGEMEARRGAQFESMQGPAIAVTAVMAAPVVAAVGWEVGMAALANPSAIATATNVAAEVAGVTGTAGATATAARALSVEAKAAQLSARSGTNSVTIKTAEGQARYDLQGASHFST